MLDKNLKNIYLGAAGGLIGLLVVFFILRVDSTFRVDLTDDRRYSLHPATIALLDSINEPICATLYLTGDLNTGFRRLQTATEDLIEECKAKHANWTFTTATADKQVQEQLMQRGYQPILVHERTQDGKMVQTTVYPYLQLTLGEKTTYINLLHNTQGLSGEENLNNSIENLEYAVAENIHQLLQKGTPRLVFLEGHGEMSEAEVYDVSAALSRYFQIDRGVLGSEAGVLDDYAAVIIADPQLPFEEKDKFILDQYIMHGGKILWLINGVRFDQRALSDDGFTPAIPLDVNLEDMLFHYGVKVRPALVQDLQCLNVPVKMEATGGLQATGDWQAVPWFYAPLLLTSETSPITRHLGQVSSVFASPIEVTAAEDGLLKQVLLATSSDSRLIPTPAKVDLADFNANPEEFQYRYLPVAIALEGSFPSAFTHRQAPRELTRVGTFSEKSIPTKQVVISCGSIIRNDWANQQPLPAGYDRYSKRTFSNRDFIVNTILWLTDTQNLIELRQKTVALRLLNKQQVLLHKQVIQTLSVIIPLGILALVGTMIVVLRKRKYTYVKKND